MKTCQKYIFHLRETHIWDSLHIMVLYIIFQGLWKISSFVIKLKGVAFGFIEKRLFTKKTGWKSIFLGREGHLLPRLDVNVLYINF
jgi:hypothetical protein